ncbi:hypothetical protein HU200_067385 [Digitaria exilis]|uniref:Cytochrome P450 n=1 Tax=Digitaria exilis TaxID=1010633 RepID=A0A835DT65_9POAL|nr:hypothetical protein HU200_067385 [Digitaria exilis]
MAETATAVCYTLLCALVVVVVAVLLKLKQASSGLNLPPGPWQLPVIGNMHCLLGALPHHAMRRLAQRYGPVMLLRLGHVRTVVVSSPEAAREVMKTHDAIFADRPLYVTMDIFIYGGKSISFAPYGSRHWKELRRLCATELLSARRILSFRPIREEETAAMVRFVAAAAPLVNVSDRVRLLLNDIIVRAVVGGRCPQREAYLQEMEKALRLLAGFNLIDLFPTSRLARVLGGRSLRAARRVHARIHSIVGDMIRDHATAMESRGAAADGEDLLDTLLRLQKGGGVDTTLSTDVISATLFRAQSEIRKLLHGKAKVKEEVTEGRLHYLRMVIKETLRNHILTAPVLCTLLCVVVFTVLLKLRSFFTCHAAGLNLPPGPWQLPIIGNMHCLLGALPHHAMRKLAQRYGLVMLLRLGHVRTVVGGLEDPRRTLADRPLYVTMDIFTYGGRDISFAPYRSRHWKELRRLCATELLGPKPVLSFRLIREEEAASLARAVAAAPAAVNVSERVKALMNDILMRCAIGDRCPMRDEYIAELDAALQLLAGFNLIDLFPSSWLARTLGAGSLRAARVVHDRLHRITHAIIDYHESKGKGAAAAAADDGGGNSRREDILDLLLRFQKDGGLGITLTTEVLSGVLFDVFAAGSETTATTTIWAMSELVRSSRAMERAQSEVRRVLQGKTMVAEADIQGRLPYLQMVIKETLRLHPPAPLILPRFCGESIKVLGFDIPEGTTVFVNVWALGRDEKMWADANEFKPERFEDETVDFSGGDFRMCPGVMFGVANIEIALANLLYHFDWKLPGGADPSELDMAESYGITARRENDLLLEATPYVPHGSES